ncbi:ABC-three component system protein [Tautonia sociabilis]|uniref:ABC-three component systems C-terminal domain-containing protein n=1 Tax=Tautonia sociabilis TaxID=2080755 RepID=A0A432MF24_9BACT|nr:ABC-three component system protein [Tautonia sociabilis]RUL84353.1 hypothetical protein TsocGM_20285 [Tautonia sociabilis]
MTTEGSPFSAADSALGYLYQCRYALLDSLRRWRQGEDFLVTVETLDDIAFEPTGRPAELLQTKHHLSRQATLTDASPDLWKSIRIWCEGVTAGSIPADAVFFLLTTATAPTGSTASYLRTKDRDVEGAFKKLVATAQTSKSQDNARAYAAFLKDQAKVRPLFERVFILDETSTITVLPTLIRQEVRPAVHKAFLEPFVERLEGWWFARVINQMAGVTPGPILSEELEDQADDLREQFKEDNLPIDDAVRGVDIDIASHIDKRFVAQLKLISVTNPRIFIAIREYFRAYEQRSRWIREDLLLVGELDRYEERLIEEWQIFFERMKENLGEAAAETEKVRAARALYQWVESEANFPIRPRCTEPFVTRGSLHILADDLRIGWHPDFAERVKRALESSEPGA